jgi:DNA mismatch endonuclease (patch repair protein)
MMSGIRSTDTRPEMLIRRGLHALGYRYRLHDRTLPGRPDLVFPKRGAVIFVNGCFWHGHGCRLFRWPATREEFWRTKITGNASRDRRVRQQLDALGWRVLDVWECSLRGAGRLDAETAIDLCVEFLEGSGSYASIKGADGTPGPSVT